jgi:hypothetical protein
VGSDSRRGLAPPADDPRGLLAPRGPRDTWPLAVGAVALLALGALSGCDSTQQKNARAELRAKRELGSRELARVTRRNPHVRVRRVTLVRGRRAGSAAVVVDLRSTASRPLTDVPIAVGVRARDGRRRLVNAKRRLDWFQTHVPAIPAGGTVTWVFEGARGVKAGDRAFAKPGVAARPPLSSAGSLPRIDVAPLAGDGGRRRVSVENASDVPQYGLQVYALALRGGRYVAAGKTRIEHLGTDQRVTVAVPLAGSARGRPLRVEAIPTTFE